jgi:acyl-CoA dehydrogenase
LSWTALFPIMVSKKRKTGNAVESENIVAETAERIFTDLADAQTINNDKEGRWKAPLWQALTEAGLPLSWVPEDCGGSGASLAEGFSVLSSAGRFAVALPLAETMLAGWLLAQAKIASPDGAMTVAPEAAFRSRWSMRLRAGSSKGSISPATPATS